MGVTFDTLLILSAITANIVLLAGFVVKNERRTAKLESTVQIICNELGIPYMGVKHND